MKLTAFLAAGSLLLPLTTISATPLKANRTTAATTTATAIATTSTNTTSPIPGAPLPGLPAPKQLHGRVRWASCTASWDFFNINYVVCGGGPWPADALGPEGTLAGRLNHCGAFPTYEHFVWEGPNSAGNEWCYFVSHLLGAKSCVGNTLDWEYGVDKGQCHGPG